MAIPIDVVKFVVKKLTRDSDELHDMFNNVFHADTEYMYYANRIREHCEDLADLLKELGP